MHIPCAHLLDYLFIYLISLANWLHCLPPLGMEMSCDDEQYFKNSICLN